MHHWIFVMNGASDDFKKRIQSGRWPIYSRTQHRNDLSSGDNVVFYLAGKLNKKLLGTAKVSSDLEPDKEHDFSVAVSEVDLWKKPIEMKKLLGSLGFIKNKDNWGMHLQGGVIPLPKEDYKKIIGSR